MSVNNDLKKRNNAENNQRISNNEHGNQCASSFGKTKTESFKKNLKNRLNEKVIDKTVSNNEIVSENASKMIIDALSGANINLRPNYEKEKTKDVQKISKNGSKGENMKVDSKIQLMSELKKLSLILERINNKLNITNNALISPQDSQVYSHPSVEVGNTASNLLLTVKFKKVNQRESFRELREKCEYVANSVTRLRRNGVHSSAPLIDMKRSLQKYNYQKMLLEMINIKIAKNSIKNCLKELSQIKLYMSSFKKYFQPNTEVDLVDLQQELELTSFIPTEACCQRSLSVPHLHAYLNGIPVIVKLTKPKPTRETKKMEEQLFGKSNFRYLKRPFNIRFRYDVYMVHSISDAVKKVFRKEKNSPSPSQDGLFLSNELNNSSQQRTGESSPENSNSFSEQGVMVNRRWVQNNVTCAINTSGSRWPWRRKNKKRANSNEETLNGIRSKQRTISEIIARETERRELRERQMLEAQGLLDFKPTDCFKENVNRRDDSVEKIEKIEHVTYFQGKSINANADTPVLSTTSYEKEFSSTMVSATNQQSSKCEQLNKDGSGFRWPFSRKKRKLIKDNMEYYNDEDPDDLVDNMKNVNFSFTSYDDQGHTKDTNKEKDSDKIEAIVSLNSSSSELVRPRNISELVRMEIERREAMDFSDFDERTIGPSGTCQIVKNINKKEKRLKEVPKKKPKYSTTQLERLHNSSKKYCTELESVPKSPLELKSEPRIQPEDINLPTDFDINDECSVVDDLRSFSSTSTIKSRDSWESETHAESVSLISEVPVVEDPVWVGESRSSIKSFIKLKKEEDSMVGNDLSSNTNLSLLYTDMANNIKPALEKPEPCIKNKISFKEYVSMGRNVSPSLALTQDFFLNYTPDTIIPSDLLAEETIQLNAVLESNTSSERECACEQSTESICSEDSELNTSDDQIVKSAQSINSIENLKRTSEHSNVFSPKLVNCKENLVECKSTREKSKYRNKTRNQIGDRCLSHDYQEHLQSNRPNVEPFFKNIFYNKEEVYKNSKFYPKFCDDINPMALNNTQINCTPSENEYSRYSGSNSEWHLTPTYSRCEDMNSYSDTYRSRPRSKRNRRFSESNETPRIIDYRKQSLERLPQHLINTVPSQHFQEITSFNVFDTSFKNKTYDLFAKPLLYVSERNVKPPPTVGPFQPSSDSLPFDNSPKNGGQIDSDITVPSVRMIEKKLSGNTHVVSHGVNTHSSMDIVQIESTPSRIPMKTSKKSCPPVLVKKKAWKTIGIQTVSPTKLVFTRSIEHFDIAADFIMQTGLPHRPVEKQVRRTKKIAHSNPNVSSRLQRIGIENLRCISKSAACCRQIALNEFSDRNFPFMASIRSLALDSEDVNDIENQVFEATGMQFLSTCPGFDQGPELKSSNGGETSLAENMRDVIQKYLENQKDSKNMCSESTTQIELKVKNVFDEFLKNLLVIVVDQKSQGKFSFNGNQFLDNELPSLFLEFLQLHPNLDGKDVSVQFGFKTKDMVNTATSTMSSLMQNSKFTLEQGASLGFLKKSTPHSSKPSIRFNDQIINYESREVYTSTNSVPSLYKCTKSTSTVETEKTPNLIATVQDQHLQASRLSIKSSEKSKDKILEIVPEISLRSAGHSKSGIDFSVRTSSSLVPNSTNTRFQNQPIIPTCEKMSITDFESDFSNQPLTEIVENLLVRSKPYDTLQSLNEVKLQDSSDQWNRSVLTDPSESAQKLQCAVSAHKSSAQSMLANPSSSPSPIYDCRVQKTLKRTKLVRSPNSKRKFGDKSNSAIPSVTSISNNPIPNMNKPQDRSNVIISPNSSQSSKRDINELKSAERSFQPNRSDNSQPLNRDLVQILSNRSALLALSGNAQVSRSDILECKSSPQSVKSLNVQSKLINDLNSVEPFPSSKCYTDLASIKNTSSNMDLEEPFYLSKYNLRNQIETGSQTDNVYHHSQLSNVSALFHGEVNANSDCTYEKFRTSESLNKTSPQSSIIKMISSMHFADSLMMSRNHLFHENMSPLEKQIESKYLLSTPRESETINEEYDVENIPDLLPSQDSKNSEFIIYTPSKSVQNICDPVTNIAVQSTSNSVDYAKDGGQDFIGQLPRDRTLWAITKVVIDPDGQKRFEVVEYSLSPPESQVFSIKSKRDDEKNGS